MNISSLPTYSDITIIGGGPVGALMALRLEETGHSVLLIEAHDKVVPDPRTFALSWGSINALQQVNAWEASLPATAIASVQVSQANSVGRTLLRADALNVPALGYVVRYDDLMHTLQKRLRQSAVSCGFGMQVKHINPLSRYAQITVQIDNVRHTLSSRLVIIATGGQILDGLNITHHLKDYQQTAIISTVSIETPHNNSAYERFAEDGPLALLPHQQEFALVWTQPTALAKAYLALKDELFIAELQKRFRYRIPQLTGIGQRYTFPLYLKALKTTVIPHIIAIGNAAQTLHPIAGQGLNLGIRDAFSLSRLLYNTPQKQSGTVEMIKRYQQLRRTDSTRTQGFTDLLVTGFEQDGPGLNTLRSLGLALLDQNHFLKQRFGQRMMFGF